MKNRAIASGVWVVLLTSGCFATTPVNQQDIQDLETHIQSLNERVDHLEASHGGTPTASADRSGNSYTATQEGDQSNNRQSPRFSAGGGFTKLVRGFTNFITGWVEIPKRIQETSTTSGAWAGWTWGLLRGVGYGFVRTAGGMYETVTFPFPAPSEYRPIIQPTFVFSTDKS